MIIKIQVITNNSWLRLAGININLVTLIEFEFENLDKIQQNSTLFPWFQFKIAVNIKGWYNVDTKTLADLDLNFGSRFKSLSNDSKIEFKDKISIIALRDDIPHTVNIKLK